ncbi:hypothetical protein [Burkholderia sp. SRS-25]|uniref:hypothetical protein n=1 Tax=Burkholderia sp. SRS-25 TaxID=2094190 RepID=UPI001F0DF30A|nr:hypothetical protein [Burkholderia sp. SRS-25]
MSIIGRDRTRKKSQSAKTRAPARTPPDLTLHYDGLSGKVLDLRIDISKGGEGRQMLKKWAGMAVVAGAAAVTSNKRERTGAIVGGALGGGAGTAAGNAMGGTAGGLVGAAVGGGAGAALGGHVSRNNSRSNDHYRGNKHKKRYKHD